MTVPKIQISIVSNIKIRHIILKIVVSSYCWKINKTNTGDLI